MRFQAPRGTEDVLPGDSHVWQRIEGAFRQHVALYGYEEVRTPTFEDTDLFLRSAGETSDIVTKQMYDFLDKGGRRNTLKTEGTAPAMRALIEHNLLQQVPRRVYYVTPVFRYERPQKGRLREHHQVGVELIGQDSPAADAEVIEVAVRFYEKMGLQDFSVLVNSLGRDECRARYREELLLYSREYVEAQEPEIQEKIVKNPLRLLDSKDPAAIEMLRGAPSILAFLEPESAQRFHELQRLLQEAGIRFEVAPGIVRGLDYYTETVFELAVSNIGAQGAIGGGGRYDKLIQELGGPNLPSVGFGIGIERALLTLEASGISWPYVPMQVFVAVAEPGLLKLGREVASDLRSHGVSAVMDYDGKSLKSQIRQADRLECSFVCVIGPDEAASGTLSVRNMRDSTQVTLSRAEAMEVLCSGG